MGVAFLTPLFLLGLLAIAVPVFIHLFRREKSRLVAFPSLMFLQRIPYRSVRQQRIRHWVLLLVRSLALALLALAFARPLLRSGVAASPAGDSRRDVALLVDRSFSMSYGDRWQRAKSAARDVVASLEDLDRAVLIAFDERAVALTELTSDATSVEAALDALEPGDGATRLGPALRLARRMLVDADAPRREVVLISDHQRSGWSPGDVVRLPQGTELVQVNLGDPSASNLAVASVVLQRSGSGSGGRQRVDVSARITSRGEQAFAAVPVSLELDGRSVQTKEVSLDPDGAVTVDFDSLSVGREDLTKGAVRIEGDALAADNAFFFVLSPAHGISAVVLDGGSRRAESLYLERALELGQRPFFRLERARAAGLRVEDLQDPDVIIVNGATALPSSAVEALMAYVEGGGGLWLILGGSPGEGSTALYRALDLASQRVVDRTADWGGSLAFIDFTHPMLELFSGPRNGDFGGAKFFRYHDLSLLDGAAPDDSGAPSEGSTRRVVARFDDGKPALVEVKRGKGRIVIWASSLDTVWNNLVLQPVFLPLAHQITTYLAAYEPRREWYTVGQVAELDPHRHDESDAEYLVMAPSGDQRTTELHREPLVSLAESGFYVARPVGAGSDEAATGGEETQVIAVNVDASESDLTMLDPEELAAAIRPFEEDEVGGASSSTRTDQREQRQRIWWYLLIAALAILALETAISNRLSLGRARSAR